METPVGLRGVWQDTHATVSGRRQTRGVGPVQWDRPWHHPWRLVGQAVERHLAGGAPLWDALNRAGNAPVRFVPHTELPAAFAYESFISQTGRCPTRSGKHDFFNGLCWINFGATKSRLNQLQAAEIDRAGVRPVRGALRDALTLFDENAAFLYAPQALWDALAAKRWQALFVDLRPLWRDTDLVLFGHALLEKLHTPRKAITAHVYRVYRACGALAELDDWVAGDLSANKLVHKPFAHLPVLGVPGWWPANEDASYYDDHSVFRPPRPCAEGTQ